MRPQRSRVRGSAVVSAVGRRIKKFTLCVTLFWLMAIFLFSFLPVPYSAVMLQKQLSAWLGGDFDYQTRQSWTPIEDISPYMTLAVIASEDQKFLTHWGFDFEAISSVMINRSRGASTLSQQTAKNLLLWNGRSWIRKGLEAGLTVCIELAWSKKRILTVYLNIAEFGNGIFGVEQASQTFFAKSAKQLTADEAALLAAVLPNPLRFKVNQPSGYVLNRQKWILRQMRLLGGTNAVKDL